MLAKQFLHRTLKFDLPCLKHEMGMADLRGHRKREDPDLFNKNVCSCTPRFLQEEHLVDGRTSECWCICCTFGVAAKGPVGCTHECLHPEHVVISNKKGIPDQS